ncbi:uncharacterized protein [Rutidosis leptorrhynchoides]|uniref:uncharacterized protein n=1 Tax=Rutidosis leptorrhynchoides TaxID=125765 RepID=UPI003A99767D
MAWVSWKQTLASLEKGGIGIGTIHGEEAGLGDTTCKTKGIWNSIVNLIKSQHITDAIPNGSMVLKIGNGYFELTNCLIGDRFQNGEWHWNWIRPPSTSANMSLFLQDLHGITLNNDEDRWVWKPEMDGMYYVIGTRRILDDYMLPTHFRAIRWCKLLPIKINIFLWRLLNDRIPTRVNLAFKGIDINCITCLNCGIGGDARDHIFLHCSMAVSLWRRVRTWVGLVWPDNIDSTDELFTWIDSAFGSRIYSDRFLCVTAATLWWIWRLRNDIVHDLREVKKSDLFDSIRLVAFSWLKSRGKDAPDWKSWLCNPM